MGGIYPQLIYYKDWLQPPITVKDQLYRGLPHRVGLSLAGLRCLLSPPLECVACGGGWMILGHGLKLSTGWAGFGASWDAQANVSHHMYSIQGHPA